MSIQDRLDKSPGGATSPRVSVIMACFNGERWLNEAVDSVLAQTFGDFELVFIDDGSTDASAQIVKSFNDERVKYHYQPNRGLAAALNAGIRNAVGEYVAFLDVDDLWLPFKLEQQVRMMDADPGIGFVFSACYTIDQSGGIVKVDRVPPVQQGQLLEKLFCDGNFIFKPTVMARKRCLEHLGGFDETFRFCEDYEMWLRMASAFEGAWTNVPLARWRRTPGSLSTLEGNWQHGLILTQKAERLGLVPQEWISGRLANLYLKRCLGYLHAGKRKEARDALQRAMSYERNNPRARRLSMAVRLPGWLIRSIFAAARLRNYCRARMTLLLAQMPGTDPTPSEEVWPC